MDFNEQLRTALSGDPAAPQFDYRGRTFTRGEIARFANRTIALLDEAAVPVDARVGIVVRNRVLHAATILGVIAHGRPLTTIYAIQPPEMIGEEIVTSGFGAVIADAEDWTAPALAGADGAGVLTLKHGDAPVVTLLQPAGSGPFTTLDGEPGLEILSSGTTGKPKPVFSRTAC